MPLRGDLLNPIPGPSIAGADLRYDPLYDKIKDARYEDDGGPQGDWQRPRKAADYTLVAKLAGDALATKSKDLWLAAWLTEAQLRREGFPGLRAGLDLLLSLLGQFWDELYPALEDGDAELRAAPLAWVGLTLGPAVRLVPINTQGHDFYRYRESRAVGYEADATDAKKQQARREAIEEKKVTAEEFDQGVEATPKAWYKALVAELDGSIDRLAELDRLGREKFGEAAPVYTRLEEALTEVQRVVHQLLAKKLEADPDPPELTPPPPSPAVDAGGDGSALEAPAAGVAVPAGEPVDRGDATSRAVAAAHYLRRTEPHSPASYLLLRGLRWGELRAWGETPDPRALEAPSSQVRTQLKSLLLEGKWAQLLEAAERTMASPSGRAWLDLQRYTVSACLGLGGRYEGVARAVQGELRALLADIPALPTMTLMDDMPTANPETLQWLREQGLLGGAAGEGRVSEMPNSNGAGKPVDRVLERAMTEARGGRSQRGIELLMDELAREKSPRARFLRRTQIARLMVESGLEQIAVPILVELLAQIESHKLPEWEAGEVVAEPMALLFRCIEKLPDGSVGDGHTIDSLYPRICSLDPIQAMSLKRSAPAG